MSLIHTIPFGRPMIGEGERAAVAEVLAGTTLTHGPKVKEFERAFAQFTGAPHAIATANCMAALHLSYLAIELGPGDEVIVAAQTHVATAHAVELCGAKPVFLDCDPRTGNIDLEALEGLITERTRAIGLVHYLGLPVDMDRRARDRPPPRPVCGRGLRGRARRAGSGTPTWACSAMSAASASIRSSTSRPAKAGW